QKTPHLICTPKSGHKSVHFFCILASRQAGRIQYYQLINNIKIMSKRIFTKEQIKELLKNKNVSKCSEKSITYSKDFKQRAVKEYNKEGLPSSEIFEKADFDLELIGRTKPKECLKAWNKIYRTKGIKALSTETRGKGGGRPKKIKDESDKDRIKRLELEIEYLKAENDFLARLRAKRK
ncbi:MAG: hypothetical protein QQN41_10625, partial [Nitrosopumilus sp.]